VGDGVRKPSKVGRIVERLGAPRRLNPERERRVIVEDASAIYSTHHHDQVCACVPRKICERLRRSLEARYRRDGWPLKSTCS
jgi:hypothetical protein